jgi:hypothetical protein
VTDSFLVAYLNGGESLHEVGFCYFAVDTEVVASWDVEILGSMIFV